MKSVFSLALLLLSCMPMAMAKPAALTPAQLQRVREYKHLLGEADPKTFAQSVIELEKTNDPELNLDIHEAMAKAYDDIVRSQDVRGQGKKQWLYSMVALNMAYLQFSNPSEHGRAAPLDMLIRQKLKHFLPPRVLNRPGFHYSLD